MNSSPEVIRWLLAGDPAIRWQVMRDQLDAPEAEWQAERNKLPQSGWAARLLSYQDEDGGWGGGAYSPKWISTTYTLLELRQMGLPGDTPQAQRGARHALDNMLGERRDAEFERRLAGLDRCIVGMLLELGVYFGVEDERVEALVENLLAERMPDGGWNCRRHRKPYPHHSSFHTTQNVLDGLRDYAELRPGDPLAAGIAAAEQETRELLLRHRLFRSHRTGEIIDPDFMLMSFPHRWFYDFLRALDYFARAGAPQDPRLQEGIDLLYNYQDKTGRWRNQKRHSGKLFFTLESGREPSRWNTLRALRVLKWWEGG